MPVAGLRFRLEVETSDLLPDAKARAENMAPAYRGPVDALVTEMESVQFATEGGLSGGWRDLSPTTWAMRRARRGGNRGGILRDTNRLWASLTKSGGPDSIRTISEREYVRGTRVPYARFHQHGTRRMVARPPIPDPIPPPYLDRLESIVTRWITEGVLDEDAPPPSASPSGKAA